MIYVYIIFLKLILQLVIQTLETDIENNPQKKK